MSKDISINNFNSVRSTYSLPWYLRGRSGERAIPPTATHYYFNGYMRSNIKYQHSDASYQLNRYQERVKELEAINESLLQNNTKLGRYLHEINDCHREKARILHNSIQ